MSEDRMTKVKADLDKWLGDQVEKRDFAPSYEEYANELIRLLRIEAVKDEAALNSTIAALELQNRILSKKCELLEGQRNERVKYGHDPMLTKKWIQELDDLISEQLKGVK